MFQEAVFNVVHHLLVSGRARDGGEGRDKASSPWLVKRDLH